MLENELTTIKTYYEDSYPVSRRTNDRSSCEQAINTPHFNSMHHHTSSEPAI
jgi:hypothetical protein